jgi:hypothetical protein
MSKATLSCALMVSLATSTLAQQLCQTPPCVCGSIVDAYQGTAAYLNGTGSSKAVAESCQVPAIQLPGQTIPPASVSGQTMAPYRLGQDGFEYRSVELVRRFYRVAKGVDTSGWQGRYGDAQQFYVNPGYFGLVSYPNSGTVPPAPDDVIGFAAVAGLSNAGLVAIAKSVDTSACAATGQFVVSLIEQNANQAHQLTGSCQQQTGGGYVYALSPRCAACLPVQGWVRVPPPTYVSFSFTGEVISVSDPNGLLGGSIAGGSPLSGEFSYDTSTLASTSGGPGIYQFNAGPVWMSLTVTTSAGPIVLSTAPVVPAGAPYLLGVQITVSPIDVFNAIAFAAPGTWPLPLSGSSPYINIELLDSNPTPTLLTSTALPTNLDFHQTDDYTNSISLGNSSFGAGQFGQQNYTVQFKLTGLTKN